MANQSLSSPPPMIQTQAGTFVPMSTSSRVVGDPKRFLLVIQYFNEDKAQAEELASLIADLERVRNKDVDVMIYGRFDATPFSPDLVTKLGLKFNSVTQLRCGRKDAKGYPFGSNGMFYELVTMLGQQIKYLNSYYAFLNLEPDCCPVGPGWLTRLIAEFQQTVNEGFYVLGHVHDNPTMHVNGVAVYAIDIWRRVPGGALGGGNPTIPFDLRQAKNLLPLAKDSALIWFEYRKATITPDELFAQPKGLPLALYHGVKDNSALEAVRAKHITFSSDRDFTRKTIFTFYNPQNETAGDEKALLALWRDGWTSRGWNPVVLRMAEAMKNGRYKAYREAVEKLPFIGDRFTWLNRWLRWLALDTVGGGFYADLNVLPAGLTPRALDGITGFETFDGPKAGLVFADKLATCAWLDQVLAYAMHEEDVEEGKPSVNDYTILAKGIASATVKSQKWVEAFGAPDFETFRAVRFSGAHRRPDMEKFLKLT